MDGEISLFLGGDVMLGRGVDQILAHPGDPALRERPSATRATTSAWPRRCTGRCRAGRPRVAVGGRPAVLAEAAPDVRIINLETSVTTSDAFAPGKGVHYRMHPANLPALSVARPDVCVLANNHVLDFGRPGLLETLDVLAHAGLRPVGAGRNADEAARPAVLPLGDGRRVLVFAVGIASSGIPRYWAATADQPGVALTELTGDAASRLVGAVRRVQRTGDIVGRVGPLGIELGRPRPTGDRPLRPPADRRPVSTWCTATPRTTPVPIEIYRGPADPLRLR